MTDALFYAVRVLWVVALAVLLFAVFAELRAIWRDEP